MSEFLVASILEDNVKKIFNAKKIFFYGIHGCGMLALAQWFLDKGVDIIGHDDSPGTVGDSRIVLSYPGALFSCDVVCMTTALASDHVFHQELKNFSGAVFTRPEILQMIAHYYQSIAITGTHGKTTTTTLLSFVLDRLAYHHHYLIGGCRLDTGHYGSYQELAKTLVFEADESNNSLSGYHPFIGVVLNAYADHLENFNYSLHDYYLNIKRFAQQVQWLIIDKSTYHQLNIESVFSHRKNIIFIEPNALSFPDGSSFSYAAYCTDLPLYLKTPSSWQHIASVLAVCFILQGDLDKAMSALKDFQGARYRLEHLPNQKFPYVWRDYGHHPNELENVFKTLKMNYPSFKKIIVFQPHKFSRTKMFLHEFVAVLSQYDHVYLMPTHQAYEAFDQEGDMSMLHALLPESIVINKIEDALFKGSHDRTTILFQGAGSIMTMALNWSKDL
jgi:UDP-N-acetylmuramate--alanine ligase